MGNTLEWASMGAGKRKASRAEMAFAQRLRDLRIECGFPTVRELARELDVLENTYSRYERAECKPDLFMLPTLFRVLRIDANMFFSRVFPNGNKRRQ